MRKSWFVLAACLTFFLFSQAAHAGIDFRFEYFRLRSKAPADVAKAFATDKKFRQNLEKEGWTLIQGRGRDSYYARREIITSRTQLESAMGGQPLTQAQQKLIAVYDFASGQPQFRGQMAQWGDMRSSCYSGLSKDKAGNPIMPVKLMDTTNVTDVPADALAADFTPWGQATVQMSTAYIQSSPQQNPTAVFVHEFSHTLDSNSMNYDQSALGKDRSHYMNEITSESNALSEAWAEYNQMQYFPAEGLTWGAGGLSDFSRTIKIERPEGGYDILPLDQIPSTASYHIPGESTRRISGADLLKTETVNLLALRNLSAALDLAYGPGTGFTLLLDAFRYLNHQKTVGKKRTLGALFKGLQERSGPRFPLLPRLMNEALQQASEGKLTPSEAAKILVPTPGAGSSSDSPRKEVKASGSTKNPFGE